MIAALILAGLLGFVLGVYGSLRVHVALIVKYPPFRDFVVWAVFQKAEPIEMERWKIGQFLKH